MPSRNFEMVTVHGHNFYDMASMLQKAIRRGEVELAGYSAFELSKKYRKYLWKRLLVISAEDCYGIMTKEIIALKLADDETGKTEDIFISKAVCLLCMARKNRDACYLACNCTDLEDVIVDKDIEGMIPIEECRLIDAKIPEWVFDCHTLRGKIKGKTINDMIVEEQKALNPHQVGMFDDPDGEEYDWSRYLDKYNK